MKKANFNYKENPISKKSVLKITLITFVAILSILWLFPFLLMLNQSFKTNMEIYQTKVYDFVKKPTFDNYSKASQSMQFWKTIWISLIVTISSNLTIIFFSSIAAWQLVRSKTWYSKTIFYIILITMIVPFQAIMIPLMNVMGSMNLANIPGLIFMYTGFGMGVSVFMMHGFLKGVPYSLEEAAKVEGYNPFRVYWKIVLPLLKPIIITIIVLNTMWIWNDFLLPYLVSIQNPDNPTTLPVKLNTSLIGTYGAQINALMAGLTILVIPAVIFFITMQKQIVAGITNGAVK